MRPEEVTVGCACNGGATAKPEKETAEYVVTYSNGRTETVVGEHNAKVKITVAGNGTYTKR
jgi:hypothetical protein